MASDPKAGWGILAGLMITAASWGCRGIDHAEVEVAPVAAVADRSQPRIVDRLLGDRCHGERPSAASVDTIVLHFCSDVAAHPDRPYDVERIRQIFSDYRVSAHYLIDREGTIYRLVPEARRAFHAGRGRMPWPPFRENTLNDTSIGIEIMGIGTLSEMQTILPDMTRSDYDSIDPRDRGFTASQYSALQALLGDLDRRYSTISLDRHHVIGHDEYAPRRKPDPGALFEWHRIGLPAALPLSSGAPLQINDR